MNQRMTLPPLGPGASALIGAGVGYLGGLFGKGFLNGTQSHLDYLPEGHTDFVFATMSEKRRQRRWRAQRRGS